MLAIYPSPHSILVKKPAPASGASRSLLEAASRRLTAAAAAAAVAAAAEDAAVHAGLCTTFVNCYMEAIKGGDVKARKNQGGGNGPMPLVWRQPALNLPPSLQTPLLWGQWASKPEISSLLAEDVQLEQEGRAAAGRAAVVKRLERGEHGAAAAWCKGGGRVGWGALSLPTWGLHEVFAPPRCFGSSLAGVEMLVKLGSGREPPACELSGPVPAPAKPGWQVVTLNLASGSHRLRLVLEFQLRGGRIAAMAFGRGGGASGAMD